MTFHDQIRTNFEVVQSKYYSLSELDMMTPFEWEIHMTLLVQREEAKEKQRAGR